MLESHTSMLSAHGTRAAYRAGCHCLPCKAAEAAYRVQLRQQRAHGRVTLGQRVSAQEAWRRIRQMRPEYGTLGALARRLGYRRPILEIGKSAITVRTLLRIRREYRCTQGESDAPPEAA